MSKRPVRIIKKTLMIVGEGESEKAFVLHLRSIFSNGKVKVQVKSAGGKGPENVINDAIATLAHEGYDFVVAFLDTDIDWPVGIVKEARSKKIVLVGSSPCLEGLLLKILGERVERTSAECKEKFKKLIGAPTTQKESYATLFNQEVLLSARDIITEIDILISKISGETD